MKTVSLKKEFNCHNEANAFVETLKGEWQLGTTKQKTVLVIYEAEVSEAPLSTKEKLKAARKILAKKGWVESCSVMHNGIKTKYNYGTTFINEYNRKSLVLNIETVDDILQHDFIQAGYNA